MKVFNGIIIFFYTLIFLAIGTALISYSTGSITPQNIYQLVNSLSTDTNIRMIIGFIGAATIVVSLCILQLAFGGSKKEKTLSYENPSGQVTVALSAIEDFVKRLARDFKEIKELRPSVKVNKEGVQILCKVYILQDFPIPEVSGKIQNTIKLKVQSLLGIEEEINVKVHIVKILDKEKRAARDKKEDAPQAPFQYESRA
ncbi:MAG: alkaline shock response membrane anchor protein AmaP [Candidatus Omnitrophica bacterium]|nr:alkaline shock response membrane anchor protein AmaP [Candidatus Omnitrophota bacterium]